jgi:hypothetical protein
MTIQIVTKILTDNSLVFNVVFGPHKFCAYSHWDAVELARKIADAIGQHSCNTVTVVGD